MNRYLLSAILAIACGACDGGDPVGPSAQPEGEVPFSIEQHVVAALASHYGVATRPAHSPGGVAIAPSGVPQIDYVEIARETRPNGDRAVVGEYLFFRSNQGPRRGRLEALFVPVDGVWSYRSSIITEGTVGAVSVDLRLCNCESEAPLCHVPVIAYRQGSNVLSSRVLQTDEDGRAQLEVFPGTFEIRSMSGGCWETQPADLEVVASGARQMLLVARQPGVQLMPRVQ